MTDKKQLFIHNHSSGSGFCKKSWATVGYDSVDTVPEKGSFRLRVGSPDLLRIVDQIQGELNAFLTSATIEFSDVDEYYNKSVDRTDEIADILWGNGTTIGGNYLDEVNLIVDNSEVVLSPDGSASFTDETVAGRVINVIEDYVTR